VCGVGGVGCGVRGGVCGVWCAGCGVRGAGWKRVFQFTLDFENALLAK